MSAAAAFVGSANASATAVKNDEAGVLVTGQRAVAELAAYIDGLATARDSTRVDDTFIDLAEKLYRPPTGGGRRTPQLLGQRLSFHSYGDEQPKSVVKAAENQRAALDSPIDDGSATLEYSWAPKGEWSTRAMCVWVARAARDASSWQAEPPAACVYRHPVGGSSKQWVYWWRTPAAPPVRWGTLRQQVLTHTGVGIKLDWSTRAPGIAEAVFNIFELSRSEAAGEDNIA